MDEAIVIDPRPNMPHASWRTMLLLGAVIVLALGFMILFALPYLTLDQQKFGPYWPRRGWLLPHIAGGMVALLIGPAQLWLGLTRQHLRLHRGLGGAYMISVGISALAALDLTFQTDFGWIFGTGLGSLATAWLLTTGLAFMAIRRRRSTNTKNGRSEAMWSPAHL
jgi:hypothetical protein